MPWPRRPEGARLLADCARRDRTFDAITIGDPQRAFAGAQFSLTFPVFVHHGVALWVPEVGGRVDPDSEAHDLVMSLFGGLSKAERSRIQRRVKTAMATQARAGGRYMGGRPPYGYRLVAAAAHPNPEKARLGATLNRLEPDPRTAPIVQRIFNERLAGRGYGTIAADLNREGIPSPAAQDPERNRHRDPRGWAESAVRAILHNGRYTGHEVWARQRREYELLDPAAPAEGHVRRMRWTDPDDWIWSPGPMHDALVSRDVWERARAPHETQRQPRGSKPTSRPYVLRGRVRCTSCGHVMHGETRGGNRRYYRCSIPRSYPQASPEHPTSVYVREDTLVSAVDEWIGELFSPAHLADTAQQLVDAAGIDTERAERIADAHQRLAEARHEIAQCRATLRAGGDPETLSSWITQAAEQEHAAQAELETAMSMNPAALRVEDVDALVRELGGLAPILEQADPVDRAALYEAFGIAATYDAMTQTALLQVEPAWGQLRVGGGT